MGVIRKRWKIGEYALGGIIDVKIHGDYISVKALKWNPPHEVVMMQTWNEPEYGKNYNVTEIESWIEQELTTYYYANKIADWIKQRLNGS